MPDVISTVCNENLLTSSSWVYLSLKIGYIGISLLFGCHTLCLRLRINEKRVPLCKVFVLPMDIRLCTFSLVSLWIIEELDFKNVLKKRTQQFVDSNLFPVVRCHSETQYGSNLVQNGSPTLIWTPFWTSFGI